MMNVCRRFDPFENNDQIIVWFVFEKTVYIKPVLNTGLGTGYVLLDSLEHIDTDRCLRKGMVVA